VCNSCAKTSQALPENDIRTEGIYKGVFSRGTLAINFKNGVENQTVTGIVYYNNKGILLNESPEVVAVEGKPARVVLRGAQGDDVVSMVFSVNEDGSNPEVTNFNISSDRTGVPCIVFKEKSNTLIEAFEGNYFLVSPGASPSPDIDSIPDVAVVDGNSGKVDPGVTGVPATSTSVGELKLILSRSEATWVMFKRMNNANDFVMDYGSIADGTLMSDVSGNRVAYLRSDELNYSENLASGAIRLHAERKR
jgi:hypothetical protein